MNTKVKVKVKNVVELLKALEADLETICTLSLNLSVSKTSIKILDNYSEDWSFVDDNDPNKMENLVEETNKIEDIDSKKEELQAEPTSYYISSLSIKDYNSLATLVEAVFRLSKNSPNIKFESGLFYNTLEIEYNNIASMPITVEHSLLAMIIETYYGNTKIKDAIDDTVSKLRGMWLTKEICGHPNTTSLTKILYGNGRS